MKFVSTSHLDLEGIQVIRFARFCDHRGYFTEHFRKSDFANHPELGELRTAEFDQTNESFSRAGTIRGMHFQWNPFMGKLVRTVSGRMVDLFLDIRKGSPTFGKASAYDLPATSSMEYGEWLWVPPGFAHGNFFTEDTVIEYFCTGEYSPGCEAGINPFASDIDWSMCDPTLKAELDVLLASDNCLCSDKDRDAMSVADWNADPRSDEFTTDKLA